MTDETTAIETRALAVGQWSSLFMALAVGLLSLNSAFQLSTLSLMALLFGLGYVLVP
jgi:hypothetical protein